MRVAAFLTAAFAASVANAEVFTILVGANKTANASQIFQPAELHAQGGDFVVFNFTNGTYEVAQSEFDAPCVPLHDHNVTLNGFDTGPRPANNGTSQTVFNLSITDNTTTIWFFDPSTCAQGGVGGININDSSTETLAGFIRNAIRLNGTNTTATSSLPLSTAVSGNSGNTGSASSSSPSATQSGTNGAQRNTLAGVALALPLAAAALFL